jgi:hypothetical protein
MASNTTLIANTVNSNSGSCTQGLTSGVQNVAVAGSDQTDGTAVTLSSGNIIVVTGADNTKCIVLPALTSVPIGQKVYILNNASGNTLETFPAVGDAINPAADNAAITTAADTMLILIKIDNVSWFGAEPAVVAA